MNILKKRYEEIGFSPENFSSNIEPTIRINSLKLDENEIVKLLKAHKVKLSKIENVPLAYYYKADFALSSMPEHLLGYFYIQELASQIPSIVLLENFKGGDITILDMCSAPGSKTTQMSALLKNKGLIVATDNNKQRLQKVNHNCERLGVTNVITVLKDAKYANDLNKKFKYVLLDAPCSGNYCIDENFFEKRTVEDIKNRAKNQRELLKSAYRVLDEDGILVYSTCSLEPEENEMNVDWFLDKYPDMKLEKINLDMGSEGLTIVFENNLNKDIKLTKRFWPDKEKTEGFFVAKLKKQAKE